LVTILKILCRYSYDVTGRNKEVNQFNGKIIYKFGEESASRLGASVEYGGHILIPKKWNPLRALRTKQGNGMLKPNLLLLSITRECRRRI
jgi:hypothetical protein